MMTMRVGVWANDLSDEALRFYRQIGVDDLDIQLRILPEFQETGCLQLHSLAELRKRIESFDLGLELVNFGWPHIHLKEAYLGQPGGEHQIDNLCKTIQNAARAGIPLIGIQVFTSYWPSAQMPGHSTTTGRGGYAQYTFNWDVALECMDAPIGQVDPDSLWEGYFRVFERAASTAEESGIRIAIHGNDPPIPEYRGIPYVLRDFAAFDRLFKAVPSASIGMTYCTGTRYESGEDTCEGIRHFGKAGRLFHLHFRNVVGQIPKDRGYKEVFLDEGDLDMNAIVSELQTAGFQGVLNIDHVPRIDSDTPDRRMTTAWAVAYTRAILATKKHVVRDSLY